MKVREYLHKTICVQESKVRHINRGQIKIQMMRIKDNFEKV